MHQENLSKLEREIKRVFESGPTGLGQSVVVDLSVEEWWFDKSWTRQDVPVWKVVVGSPV